MIRYAKSFVDRLYEAKDVFGLDGVIAVVGQERQLPEQFWLFRRLLAWAGSTRSRVWQYYEAITEEEFESVALALDRFGLIPLAGRFRSGMESWKTSSCCDELDGWIDLHWPELESVAFGLIANDRHFLYGES
jgi:hypothetical protein